MVYVKLYTKSIIIVTVIIVIIRSGQSSGVAC